MKIPQILKERAAQLEEYYSVHYKPLAPLVRQCFLNTIETTVKELEDGRTCAAESRSHMAGISPVITK